VSHTSIYPLLTEQRLVAPMWSGHRLAAWLGVQDSVPRVGETWQVYEGNKITNGPLAGQTLAEATDAFGDSLVGTRTTARYGRDFPLLAKLIDADDALSVQVHPDDAYAHRVEAATGFHGKTEAWHILAADAGASLAYGFARPVSAPEVAAAVADGTLETLLQSLAAAPGDTVYVPAGTVHAIGPGILLYEIQQKSDLTYRIYDYGRKDAKTGLPRALHLDKALDVLDFNPPPRGRLTPLTLARGRDVLLACPLFALESWRSDEPLALSTDPGTFEILTVIDGVLRLQWDGGALDLRRQAVVLPAGLRAYTLTPEAGSRWLRAYVPDLAADLIGPLHAAGYSEEAVRATVID
jgi:mannose-6-phosphate isomerase